MRRLHVLVPDEAALDLVGRADHVDQELQVRRHGGRGRGRAAAALPARAPPARARARAAQRHHRHARGRRAAGPARRGEHDALSPSRPLAGPLFSPMLFIMLSHCLFIIRERVLFE